MKMNANTNADRHPASRPGERVRINEPLALGVGKALRCAYAQAGSLSDLRTFDPLIAALRGK